jgi:hypothetical protein
MSALHCAVCRVPGAQWRRQSGSGDSEFFAVCSSGPCIAATIGAPITKRPAIARGHMHHDTDSDPDSISDPETDEEWRDRQHQQRRQQRPFPTMVFCHCRHRPPRAHSGG